MMPEHDHIDQGVPERSGEGPFNPAGELVRFAEKLLEQGDIIQALECLGEALARQPENLYITAVIQRAEALRADRAQSRGGSPQKPLRVTVDKRSPSGVRPQPSESVENTDARVRHLTLVASRLFDRGAFDAAFESLMKAYLIDPGNPLVLACEKQMMPLWDTLRKTGLPASTPEQFMAARKAALAATTPAPAPVPPPASQTGADSAARLEERKRQLEQQRKDREQTMWRNASRPPKTMTAPAPKESPRPAPPRLRDLDKYDRPGIFRWLKGD